jgi:pyroglutamyl-peptidase
MQRTTVLLTGFNRFGGKRINSSELVVEAIASRKDRPWLEARVLRTEFVAGARRLGRLLFVHRPAFCICLGLHEQADCLVIERYAHNCDDAAIPDNAGYQPRRAEIVAGGAEAYPSTLPIDAMAIELKEHGIPFRFSDSAGSFVCNHAFYVAAHVVESRSYNTRVGFIHLPPVQDEGGSGPGVRRNQLISAIELCIDLCNEKSILTPFRHGDNP